MSDNIPFEIQMEIIQRIPDPKSLIQFRSVSKAWKSVIDSKEFVTAHTLRHTHHQANWRLLIRTEARRDHKVEYMSIVDDDSFPHRKHRVFVPSDSGNKFFDESRIVGTSHGLFCLYHVRTSIAVIWNPLIRKTVDIAVPNVLREQDCGIVVGFGVCPRNLDPKLVKITVSYFRSLPDVNARTQVEVFTLSSEGTWRSPLSGDLAYKSISFGSPQAVVDGFIYWGAVDRSHRTNESGGYWNPTLIMSFDLTSEEFTKVNLPDPLALDPDACLSLSNLKESLAVLHIKFDGDSSIKFCHVWQMIGQGCTRSFNKLYSFNPHVASIRSTLGFLKSGAPIIKVKIDNENDFDYELELAIYEPESNSITNIGIHGLDGSFSVHSYMETLLLFGH